MKKKHKRRGALRPEKFMKRQNNEKSKIFELTHTVLLLSGTLLLIVSFFLLPDIKEGLKGILYSLGTAFLASSFIGLFNKRYLAGEITDMRKEWGLVNIYKTRVELDDLVNSCIKTTAEQIDGIVQGGLYNLRRSQDIKLAERLEQGLEMRLLIPLDSRFDPRMEEANKELEDWYHGLNANQKNNVKIRRYTEAPQELYYRVDNILLIGPYFAHIDGPRNITYLFDANSTGGKIYKNHFDDLWESSKNNQLT
jgi:hypothetical protein